MTITRSLARFAFLALATCLGSSAFAQTFEDNTTQIPSGNPFNNSFTENVDFADVDLDGDWDAVFADGGDCCNDQSRIWINLGGLQGGTVGFFADETSTRFPAMTSTGRDIEFVDFDNDGDQDLYLSNTSAVSLQSNLWWTNQGGLQGGTLGFYTNQTSTRWVNVGVNGPTTGSSVPANFVVGSGGFVDWSCDCDFADLDNDGDMDLFHSSYGGSFAGDVPSRIFLNNGSGNFEEFNPSDFQLPASGLISDGSPGLWCEGTHQDGTTNTTGTQCDIADSPLDLDLADFDGDLDIDILHGARNEIPRIFQNRLQENGGTTLSFRDILGTAIPLAHQAVDGGNYEQETGDFDRDGDIDIYGLNWGLASGSGSVCDSVLANNGSGVFNVSAELSNSCDDDNESDFIDYDNDGDMDVFCANFSGQDRLYRYNGSGVSFTEVTSSTIPTSTSVVGLDADVCDVDKDGDYDIFVANDGGTRNMFLKNNHTADDTHAPALFRLEQRPNRSASTSPTIARVQVYDNAPYYITWYNRTALDVLVDGIKISDHPLLSNSFRMRTSGGQIFRGSIYGHLVGTVTYSGRSQDEYNNLGTTPTKTYTGSGSSGTLYGSSTPGNAGTPTIEALSEARRGMPLILATDGTTPGVGSIVRISRSPGSHSMANGLFFNIGGPLEWWRFDIGGAPSAQFTLADANGNTLYVRDIPDDPSLAGVTLYCQHFNLDGAGAPLYASSQGLSITIQ